MNAPDLIRLAEFVKPRSIREYRAYQDAVVCDMANGSSRLWSPTTDSNHCEDLIASLMLEGWHVEVLFQSYPEDVRDPALIGAFGVFLHIWHVETEHHERVDCSLDAWKRCLCQLALKAITAHDEQEDG